MAPDTKVQQIERKIASIQKQRRLELSIVRRHRALRLAALALPVTKANRDKAKRELDIVRRHRAAAQQARNDVRALHQEVRRHNWLVRHVRHNRPVVGKNGLTWVDGHQVATWIAKILIEARRAGVQFTVTSGIRSLATANYLWNNAARLGLIHYVSVAYPCTSNHCGFVFPKGAVDLWPFDPFRQWLRHQHARGRHTDLQSYADIVGPRDNVHFSHTGH